MLRTISSIFGVGLIAAGGLLAAEFWASKPYTEWTPKDIQKLMENSPWAHRVPVAMSGRGGGGAGRGGRGSSGVGDVASPTGGESIGGGGAANRRGAVGGEEGMPGSGNTPAVNVLIRWQSALPIKQAMVKEKAGAEAATSADAQNFLKQDEPNYVVMINVPGMRGSGGGAEGAVAMIKQQTMLKRKGKEPLYPEKVQIVPQQSGANIFLMFPKKDPIVEDDKDVEFVFQSQFGEIKYRFKLKDMMFGDKLAL